MAHPTPDPPSRRDFLAAAVTATGSVAAQPAAGPTLPQPSTSDFTRGSAAIEPDKVVTSACQFCSSLCGLKVHPTTAARSG